MPTEEERYRIGEPRYEAPGVQKELAAKVAEMERRQREICEAPLRARIAELEGKLAEITAAAEDCDINGWDSESVDALDAVLSNPSSLTSSAQALLRLVKAVGKLRACGAPEVEEDLHDLLYERAPKIYSAVIDILSNYVGLLAVRAGRGEGE